jgi:glycosyltransferase involved in cell wall biosynthesis
MKDSGEEIPAAIIIPAHNEEAYLKNLLDSIRVHGPKDSQVIVIDNGSTDDTSSIATAFGVNLIKTPGRLYPSQARNLGVASVEQHREVLIFFDADVELTSEWRHEWNRTASLITENRLQVTGGTYDVSKAPCWLERNWFAPMRSRKWSHINGGNLITTKTLFNLIAGFDLTLETGEDADFCIRAHRIGANVVINDAFRVYHEGYPRTLYGFIRRERWHGSGDFVSLRRALRSQVAIATVAFATLHAALFAGLAGFFVSRKMLFMPLICAAAISVLCLASALKMLPRGRYRAVAQATCIMYFYYFGRSLSMVDALTRAVRSNSLYPA